MQNYLNLAPEQQEKISEIEDRESRERFRQSLDYERGFHCGYLKGKEEGLRLYLEMLKLRTEPMLVRCVDEETAKELFKSLTT